MVSPEFVKMLDGYGLTTAHILYRMPDHLDLLQSFVWQTYDVAPQFPEIEKFLRFWSSNLDGPIHSVRLAHKGLIVPADYRSIDCELTVH
jgi:uncharacterized protein Usg